MKKNRKKDNKEKKRNTASQFHALNNVREAGKLKISTLTDIFNSPDPQFLVEPILHQNTLTLLTAYTGVGKSLLALSIAKSIITQEPLWGNFTVHKSGPVLYIDEETPSSFLKKRLKQFSFKKIMPLYFLHYQSVKIDDQHIFSQLIKRIRKYKPILVIFDTLIRVHDASENDNAEMSKIMGWFRKIINITGTTVLIIHHDRKGRGNKIERSRGAVDIIGAVDLQLCLEAENDGILTLSPGKSRVSPFNPIKLKLDGGDGKLEFTCVGREMPPNQIIISAVVKILGESSMGLQEIYDCLNSKGINVGENKLRDILKQSNGKELMCSRIAKGKFIYQVKPASQFHLHVYERGNSDAESNHVKDTVKEKLKELQPLWEKSKPHKKDHEDV